MRKYNKVHTGPNTQLGGEKKGFTKKTYQADMAATVKGVLAIPTSSHPITEIISLYKFFILSTV